MNNEDAITLKQRNSIPFAFEMAFAFDVEVGVLLVRAMVGALKAWEVWVHAWNNTQVYKFRKQGILVVRFSDSLQGRDKPKFQNHTGNEDSTTRRDSSGGFCQGVQLLKREQGHNLRLLLSYLVPTDLQRLITMTSVDCRYGILSIGNFHSTLKNPELLRYTTT